MSLAQRMREKVGRSRGVLEDATPLVEGFLRGQMSGGGGFCDRSGCSDLYFSVFGLEALRGLGARFDVDRARGFLEKYGDGAGLDFVHLCCLARCWASVSDRGGDPGVRSTLMARLRQHRSADGGYSLVAGAERGSIYACFLALGSCGDMGVEVDEPAGVVRCLQGLRVADGGYANDAVRPVSTTPTTAAAVTLLTHLGETVDEAVLAWLASRQSESGGFLAHPASPMPDLLSTGTAVYALGEAGYDLGQMRERCLDFVDGLWSSRGGFRATLDDDVLDCEYCWYGLLTLGCMG